MRRRRLGVLAALVVACALALAAAVATKGSAALTIGTRTASSTTTTSCQLKSPKGNVKHVIYIQFDNTHFRRDNADVPSDLEQMPHRSTSSAATARCSPTTTPS